MDPDPSMRCWERKTLWGSSYCQAHSYLLCPPLWPGLVSPPRSICIINLKISSPCTELNFPGSSFLNGCLVTEGAFNSIMFIISWSHELSREFPHLPIAELVTVESWPVHMNNSSLWRSSGSHSLCLERVHSSVNSCPGRQLGRIAILVLQVTAMNHGPSSLRGRCQTDLIVGWGKVDGCWPWNLPRSIPTRFCGHFWFTFPAGFVKSESRWLLSLLIWSQLI